MKRQVILVIGMHRSGTSAVARVLSLCGAALPVHVMARNFGNPTGYWEPQRAVELNEHFARAHGSSWDDPRFGLQLNPVRDEERRTFVTLIAEFLESGFRPGGAVVVKDPRITVLLPYWLEAARELGWPCKVVHVFRHPAGVAASLRARDGMEPRLSLALWLKYNLLGERDARGIPRVFLPYEELLSGWEDALERCVAALRLELPARAGASAQIAEFLSPELRHFGSSLAPGQLVDGALHDWVERTFELLEAGSRGLVRSAVLDAMYRDYVQAGVLAGAGTSWRAEISAVAEGPHRDA